MTKILLLGSQHGNELLGEYFYNYIKRQRSELLPFVTYRTGNIRARRMGIRFLESDLNRSYGGGDKTYEERRAQVILRFIKKEAFNLVLDLHTTTCHQPPCLIVSSNTSGIDRFIRASSFRHVVQMSQAIAGCSLIGTCMNAISIEVNEATLSDALMNELCGDIGRFIQHESTRSAKEIYAVNDHLKKGELPLQAVKELRNFEYSKYGFYPILVGENSYKKHTSYLGFKAYKVRLFKV